MTIHSAMATAATEGRIALAVAFTGDAKGTLRLVGTPRYSPQRKHHSEHENDYIG